MNVAKSSTDRNLSLKGIVAQRHDLCGIEINRFGHVVFGGYGFIELVQTYEPSIQGNFDVYVQNQNP